MLPVALAWCEPPHFIVYFLSLRHIPIDIWRLEFGYWNWAQILTRWETLTSRVKSDVIFNQDISWYLVIDFESGIMKLKTIWWCDLVIDIYRWHLVWLWVWHLDIASDTGSWYLAMIPAEICLWHLEIIFGDIWPYQKERERERERERDRERLMKKLNSISREDKLWKA